jgi:hypothetical protein
MLMGLNLLVSWTEWTFIDQPNFFSQRRKKNKLRFSLENKTKKDNLISFLNAMNTVIEIFRAAHGEHFLSLANDLEKQVKKICQILFSSLNYSFKESFFFLDHD